MTNDQRTDAELLKASVRDAESFGLFYDRHNVAVRQYFLRRSADSTLSNDLTAETFAEAFASRRRYRKTTAPATSWLFTIAARQLNEFWRKERVSTKHRDRLGIAANRSADSFERVEEQIDAAGWVPALSSALDALSATSAEAVILRVGHGWTYQELSERLGCTPAAARVRVSRALNQLEQHVKPPTDPLEFP